MCTKIIQNTKFVYILYTKIVQIKILYDNECTKNVHQIPSNIQKQTAQNLYKVQIEHGFKLAMYVFCIQKMYKLYKTYTTS